MTDSAVTTATYTINTNPNTTLPAHILTGYWQNFINNAGGMKLAETPVDYNLICVSFADATSTPGEIVFNLDPKLSKALGGYTDEEFKNDIKIAHSKGQKVILAIGGELGNVIINSPQSAQAFADSAYNLMQEYGFDGIDVDLEHGINVTNLANALHLLAAKAGPSFILTFAPQTLDVYTYDATYLKLARATKDILTIMNTQFYNSGSMPGYDQQNYTQGSIGFLNAISTTALEAGLRPDQIGIGLPAVPAAAGGGYQNPANCAAAIESLVYGKAAGGFTPPKAYNDFRGGMTWSINWDKTNNYNFAKTMTACYKGLPASTITVDPTDPIDPPKPEDIKVTSVTLNQNALSLTEGDTAKLTATVNPTNATNKNVSWTSSNSSVATVSNGNITALKEGTVTITATAGTKSASCTITVAKKAEPPKPDDVKVTSVTLNQTNIDLAVNNYAKLTATVNPDNATKKTVAWKTSNSAIATVDSTGTIKGIKAGTVTITATADGKSASCKVTVKNIDPPKPEDIKVTSVTLNKNTLSLEAGNTSVLIATVKPDNATNKNVSFSTSDQAIVSVAFDGSIKANKAGTATITATAEGKSATCVVTVTEPAKPGEKTDPPFPFWKDYQTYPIKGTKVYYQGKIYENKWYVNAGFKPANVDPWVLVGDAEWTVPENEANYKRDEQAESNAINKVLSTEEINKLYGGIKAEYSPE
ncbi:MAG: Ig-like domain-containing protein, partial [Oscillospiraceae bacterium]